ncbi:MAG: hypothetical protein ACQERU_13320 [Bacteroidota bacterium]
MDLYDSFTTGIVFNVVERFSKVIQTTQAFQYFSQEDTNVIKEYKNFETTLIASAMTVISLDMDLKDKNQKKDIQTVYLGKSVPFLRKIQSKEYKAREYKIDEQYAKRFFNNNIQAMLYSETRVKFAKYLKEVKESLKENSPSYFLKYDEPEIDYFTGEEKSGYSRVYDYLINVLLAEETIDHEDYENNNPCIGFKVYLELNQQENELLKSFVNDLRNSLNN